MREDCASRPHGSRIKHRRHCRARLSKDMPDSGRRRTEDGVAEAPRTADHDGGRLGRGRASRDDNDRGRLDVPREDNDGGRPGRGRTSREDSELELEQGPRRRAHRGRASAGHGPAFVSTEPPRRHQSLAEESRGRFVLGTSSSRIVLVVAAVPETRTRPRPNRPRTRPRPNRPRSDPSRSAARAVQPSLDRTSRMSAALDSCSDSAASARRWSKSGGRARTA